MSVTSHREVARTSSWAIAENRRIALAVGIPLFLLLIFTTLTVFVRESWALLAFELGIYVVTAIFLLWRVRGGNADLASGIAPWLVYLIPAWGAIQIAAHWTISNFDTRQEALRWGALAGVFFLVQTMTRGTRIRHAVLNVFLGFATFLALLCLAQLFTSEGRVFWTFDSGYPDVYASFANYNNYCQFAELALPIALWRAVREGWRSWGYGFAAGVLFASVVGSASRAGVALCVIEVLAVVIFSYFKTRDDRTGERPASTKVVLILVPVLAIMFTFIVGWRNVWTRFQQHDPFLVRHEFIISAIHETEKRPLTGFGLGTFPVVYQQFAIKDFPFYANHTHCDWAEFAADGGLPFLFLVLVPFVVAVPTALRHPWAWGLIAVMIHACVDYPFPRPAVSGWIFLMLALVYVVRTAEKRDRKSIVQFPTNAGRGGRRNDEADPSVSLASEGRHPHRFLIAPIC